MHISHNRRYTDKMSHHHHINCLNLQRNSMCPPVEKENSYINHYGTTSLITGDCSNKDVMTMVTNSNDVRCSKNRTIPVFNYSFLTLLRKSPNENPPQFNQCRGLVLKFDLYKTNLIRLVTKHHTKRSIWWFNVPVKNAFQ